MGVGPTSQAWEARILPMYYTRKGLYVYCTDFGVSCQDNLRGFLIKNLLWPTDGNIIGGAILKGLDGMWSYLVAEVTAVLCNIFINDHVGGIFLAAAHKLFLIGGKVRVLFKLVNGEIAFLYPRQGNVL